MGIHQLQSVDGFVAFDFEDAPVSAGGTRYAPDVSESETALLARAMTYKFAVLGRRTAGAKGAVRGTPEQKNELIRRYCDEIRPLVESAKFLTGADLGTSYEDFASLRDGEAQPHVMGSTVDGVALEDLVTGRGVVAGTEAAVGSLEGLSIALEGFGKVGSGLAREAVRRGARITAISSIEGCTHDAAGLDLEALLALRGAHGDGFVHHAHSETKLDPRALFDVEADVLVPGARTAVITRDVAAKLRVRWIAPAANAPYTSRGVDILERRGIKYLPDFVLNAGAVVGFVCREPTAAGVLQEADRVVSSLMSEAAVDPAGPYAGACRIAERFLATWRTPNGMPEGPPLA